MNEGACVEEKWKVRRVGEKKGHVILLQIKTPLSKQQLGGAGNQSPKVKLNVVKGDTTVTVHVEPCVCVCACALLPAAVTTRCFISDVTESRVSTVDFFPLLLQL